MFRRLREKELVEDHTFMDWKDTPADNEDVAAAVRASLMKTAMWFNELETEMNRVPSGDEDDEGYYSDEGVVNDYLGGDALLMKQDNTNQYGDEDVHDFGFGV